MPVQPSPNPNLAQRNAPTAGRFRRSALTIAAAALSTLLAGCALENSAAPTQVALPAIAGRSMGGSTPIYNAAITLWETDPGNSGYGVTAKSLATTNTVANGAFSFSTSYTCDSGTFLYLTGTGGDVSDGNGTVNPNNVQMAALGSCSKFATPAAQANVNVYLNEVSTVASAFALGAFTTVAANGSVGTQSVYVGAPANNNASTGSCSGVGGSMTCVAAGLAHAFANAALLSDSVHFDGTMPTGLALTAPPTNSLASVPQAQIHLLANILAYCVATAGGSGTAGTGGLSDGSHCGNLFSSSKSVTCTTTACVPTDTLTAMIDIAKNPEHNISTLFAYSAGTAAPFQPTLTGAPQNWAIAITYNGIKSNLGSPQYLALDANDDVYVVSGDLPTPTQAEVAAMSSSGAPLWNTGYSTSFCLPNFIATDTVGTVWVANNAPSSAVCGPTTGNYFINGYSQSAGALNYNFGPSTSTQNGVASTSSPIGGTSTPNGLAIDQHNNLWFDRSSTSADVYELVYSSGATPGGTYANEVDQATGLSSLGQILLDAKQNVWFSTYANSATGTPQALYVIPNANAASSSTAPSYPGAAATTPFYSYTGPGASGGYSFGMTFDSSGNIWDEASNGGTAVTQEMVVPTTAGVVSGNPTASTITFKSETKPIGTEFDGQGQLWLAYFSATGEIYFVYNPTGTAGSSGTAQSVKGIIPCTIVQAVSASACSGTVFSASPRGLQIDSTGSVWFTGEGSATTSPGNGAVFQLIGAAYPTWPQLSYAHFGTQPQ